ncbi:hypothetical protein EZS27_036088, partial [termite gut metagenome]
VKALAENKQDDALNKAIENASALQISSQDDFVTLFVREYRKLAPEANLSGLFATQRLKDKVTQRSTDSDIEKVLREEINAAVTNSYNVLRTRIDRFGVVQPNIQQLKDRMGRIMVELPGIKEPERVRKLLQGSANLEFWETYHARDILPYMQMTDTRLRTLLAGVDEEDAERTAENNAEVSPSSPDNPSMSAADSLAAALSGEKNANTKNTASAAQYKKEYPFTSIFAFNTGGQGPVVGYANYKDTAQVNKYFALREITGEFPRELRLKWGVSAVDPQGQTFELYAIKAREKNGKAPLEGDVISDANDGYDQYSKPCVNMSMNNDGARRWALLTKQNIGNSVAIVLDGYVYSAPNVNSEITGGRSEISGHFTAEEAKDLANVLKAGKMPAPARIVQEDIVGPSLGQASINAGIFSFIVALIALMLFMCSI